MEKQVFAFSRFNDSDDEDKPCASSCYSKSSSLVVAGASPRSQTNAHSWRTMMNEPSEKDGWQTKKSRSKTTRGGRGRGRGGSFRGQHSGHDNRRTHRPRNPRYWNYFNSQAILIGIYSLAERLGILSDDAHEGSIDGNYKEQQIFTLKKKIEEVFVRFRFRESYRRDPINMGCVHAILEIIDSFDLDKFPDKKTTEEAIARRDATLDDLERAREIGHNTMFIESRLARHELGTPYTGKWWANLLFNKAIEIYCNEAMKDTRLTSDEMPHWKDRTPAESDKQFTTRASEYQKEMETKLQEKRIKTKDYAEEKARNRIITIVGGYGDDLIVHFLQDHKYKKAFANSAQASARADGSRFENNGLQNLAFGDKRVPSILGESEEKEMDSELLATYDTMRKNCIVAFYNTGTIDRSLLNGYKETVYDLLTHSECKFPKKMQEDTAKFIRGLTLRPLINRETKPYFQIPNDVKSGAEIIKWCKGLFSVTDGNPDILETHIKSVVHSLLGLGDPYITSGDYLVHRANFFPYIFYIHHVISQLGSLNGQFEEGAVSGAGERLPDELWIKNFFLNILKERMEKHDMRMDPLGRVRALTIVTGLYSMEKVDIEDIDFFHNEVVRFIPLLDAEGSPLKKSVCQGLVTAILTARHRAEALWDRYLAEDIHLFRTNKCFDSLCHANENIPSKDTLLNALRRGKEEAKSRGEKGVQFMFYDEKITQLEAQVSAPKHRGRRGRQRGGNRGRRVQGSH